MKIYNNITKDIIYQDCNAISMQGLVEQAINQEIDLSYADLSHTDLSYANLSHTDLSYANLSHTYLSYTDLRYAKLHDTDLSYTDLSYTDLHDAICNNREVKTIQTGKYIVNIINDIDIQIGCKRFSIEDWFDFTDRDILLIDGKGALNWWKKWKPILKAIIKEVK